MEGFVLIYYQAFFLKILLLRSGPNGHLNWQQNVTKEHSSLSLTMSILFCFSGSCFCLVHSMQETPTKSPACAFPPYRRGTILLLDFIRFFFPLKSLYVRASCFLWGRGLSIDSWQIYTLENVYFHQEKLWPL